MSFQTADQMTSRRAETAAREYSATRFTLTHAKVTERRTGRTTLLPLVVVHTANGTTYPVVGNCCCCMDSRRLNVKVAPCKHVHLTKRFLAETAAAARATARRDLFAAFEEAGRGDAFPASPAPFPEAVEETMDRPTAADEDRAARARLLELARARVQARWAADWGSDDVELDRR